MLSTLQRMHRYVNLVYPTSNVRIIHPLDKQQFSFTVRIPCHQPCSWEVSLLCGWLCNKTSGIMSFHFLKRNHMRMGISFSLNFFCIGIAVKKRKLIKLETTKLIKLETTVLIAQHDKAHSFIIHLVISGDAGDWTRGLSHAKRTRYHCATSPTDILSLSCIYIIFLA